MLFGRYDKVFLLSLLLLAAGCKKYLTVAPPVYTVAGTGAFMSDSSAVAVLNGIYSQLLLRNLFQGNNGIGYDAGLYTDELQSNLALFDKDIYTDALVANNISLHAWSDLYKAIYATNLAIEGLTPTSLSMRSQLLGEAYFLRAFLHFYLTNLFGAVPIAIHSAYEVTNVLVRSPQADVYRQVIADLKEAQTFFPDDQYRDQRGAVTDNRGRPNRMAATALLSRVYLYTGDWANAAEQAGLVIGAGSFFALVRPASVFLAGSKETIWGMESSFPGGTPLRDAQTYYTFPGTVNFVCLDSALFSVFEPGDARWTNWVGVSHVAATATQPATDYYFDYKYKDTAASPSSPGAIALLRLGELYLIRAEARAEGGDLAGAVSDLNAIRARASLGSATAVTQAELREAILHERQVELFLEEGHRFFDLRRTGQLDVIMTRVAPVKGGTWSPYKQWWPIPITDIQSNPNLVQTPGY
jgi:hypothetical protein